MTKIKRRPTSGRSTSRPAGPVPSLELYQTEASPESHTVRARLAELGLDFIAHTVSLAPGVPGHDLKHKRLVDAGGRDRIPFLIDHRTGAHLYDAPVILKYLEKEYGEVPETNWLGAARRARTRLRNESDEIAWTLRQSVDRLRQLRTQAGETWRLTRDSADLLWGTVKRAIEP